MDDLVAEKQDTLTDDLLSTILVSTDLSYEEKRGRAAIVASLPRMHLARLVIDVGLRALVARAPTLTPAQADAGVRWDGTPFSGVTSAYACTSDLPGVGNMTRGIRPHRGQSVYGRN